ncbi:uncharacterized protein L969DRAFT_51980 [Mixia osmundae IAM 14324]|uniref:Uncharacterized protein n=1 Tax=Mixia osmundae (strain CBS 9802 / IAM 14324 / JCM 22182 / KY 12970) TaxID=764103 RepID=G7DWN4_MIXOS|nr:uncharacterized protein L969DRAFT_51980 [Mixia osmundae IAM 14324]KEI37853.1 hypothetical protein L969DRAFT_51980 [Mixia osmundae IAM 14324]GAA94994.1 hypothetical protein E5Q_01649 [Mixia osmundae IAM 14324]
MEPNVKSEEPVCIVDSAVSNPEERQYRMNAMWPMMFKDSGTFAPAIQNCCRAERHFTVDLDAMTGEWAAGDQQVQLRCPKPGLTLELRDQCYALFGDTQYLHTCELIIHTSPGVEASCPAMTADTRAPPLPPSNTSQQYDRSTCRTIAHMVNQFLSHRTFEAMKRMTAFDCLAYPAFLLMLVFLSLVHAGPIEPATRNRCVGFEQCRKLAHLSAFKTSAQAEKELILIRYTARNAKKLFTCLKQEAAILSGPLVCKVDNEESSPSERKYRMEGIWTMPFNDTGPFAPTLEACCTVERHFLVDLNVISGQWALASGTARFRCPRGGLVEDFDHCRLSFGNAPYVQTCDIEIGSCLQQFHSYHNGKCFWRGEMSPDTYVE